MTRLLLTAMMGCAIALPAAAQTNMPQMLQGLLTGNQNQDRAVRDAYERGYRQGRQDEAQLSRRPRSDDRYDRRGSGGDDYPTDTPYRR